MSNLVERVSAVAPDHYPAERSRVGEPTFWLLLLVAEAGWIAVLVYLVLAFV